MYRALRGVCIGVGRIVSPQDAPFDLDDGTAQFLLGIGAVEKVAPAPAAPAAHEDKQPAKDAKASKKGT